LPHASTTDEHVILRAFLHMSATAKEAL
jgi:hypothetical protein